MIIATTIAQVRAQVAAWKKEGLTVGLVVHGVMGPEKKAAYDADITYGTNNEFGFDYLRDNMAIYSQ